jgi:hypothetical protein
MFCPICKAEYRQGFTHCSDCDVDLVDAISPRTIQATQAWEKSVQSGGYTEQLWQGEDPHFYLSLLWSIWNAGIPCLGRPARPPSFDYNGKTSYQKSGTPSFEIRVSESSLTLARWALESARETFEKKENADGAIEESPKKRDEAVSVCPLCGAQFAVGTPTCPNCRVALCISYDESDVEDLSRLLCNLPHPQFSYAIRAALLEADIPFNDAGYSGRNGIFGGRRDSTSDYVIVLESDYNRATQVLARVLQLWEFEPGAGFDRPRSPLQSYWPARAAEEGWLPEDLTAIAWSGGNLSTMSGLVLVLREHKIPYTVDISQIGSGKLMVHPDDEIRAREVLREVVEGVLPE